MKISKQVDEAEHRVQHSFKKISELSDCDDSEKEAELKKEHEHYFNAKQDLDSKKEKMHAHLKQCGVKRDCDMTCVRECSFLSWAPWVNCFSACGCVDFVGQHYEFNHYEPVQQQINFNVGYGNDGSALRASGHTTQRSHGYYWSWIGLDRHRKCHVEQHHTDGTKTSVACPTSEECHLQNMDPESARLFLELRSQIRSAASSVFSLLTGKTGVRFLIEREVREKHESHLTLEYGETHVMFKVQYFPDHRGAYKVSFLEGDTIREFYVFLKANLDESYTGIIADGSSFLFTHSIGVLPHPSRDSLGGWSYEVRFIALPQTVYEHFSMIREKILKEEDRWNRWVRVTKEHSYHDFSRNTTTTITSYIRLHPNEHDEECKKLVTHVWHHNKTIDWSKFEDQNDTHHSHHWFHNCTEENTTVTTNHTETHYNYTLAYVGNVTYKIMPNGNVIRIDTNETICFGTGLECLREYVKTHNSTMVVTINYKTIYYKGETYTLYENGTLINPEGHILTNQGSVEWLEEYLRPKYHTYFYKGIKYRVYRHDDGSEYVTDIFGKVIIKNGGYNALLAYLAPKYTKYWINDQEFYVYNNGTVTEPNSTVVIKQGGFDKLIQYIVRLGSNLTDFTMAIIDDKEYIIYHNGTVTNKQGEIILEKGGLKRLKEEFQQHFLKVYISTLNGTNMTFHLYKNDTGTLPDGTVVTTRGIEGLKEYYRDAEELPVKTFDVLGNVYYLYHNGSVISEHGVMVVKTGGRARFMEYVKGHYGEDKTEITTPHGKFTLYHNGTTVDAHGEYVVNGGFEGFQAWYKNFTQDKSVAWGQIDGVNFTIYGNGTLIFSNGTEWQNYTAEKVKQWEHDSSYTEIVFLGVHYKVDEKNNVIRYMDNGSIFMDGNETQFINWIESKNFTEVFYWRHNEDWKHEYVIHKDGKVLFGNGTVLFEEGGLKRLYEWAEEHYKRDYDVYVYKGHRFHVFSNGTVTLANGHLISKDGGVQALQDFVYETYSTSYQVVTINETDGSDKQYVFRVFDNGTIVWDDNGTYVMNGTVKELRQWANQEFNLIVETVTLEGHTYYIYSGGLVTDHNGTVIF